MGEFPYPVPVPANVICLVDDEPSVLRALGRLLASDGLYAEKFWDPADFLEHARRHPVKVAVIDVRMPGMTGLEVLRELRTISHESKVIMMTGQSDPVYRSAALAAGACDFFLKPFDDEKFLQAMRTAVGSPV